MTLDKIKKLDQILAHTTWKNIMSGEEYFVLGVAYDATNKRDGSPVVMYNSLAGTFCRDFVEFKTKFVRK